VTHQKRTMEIASMMYGVSLNKDGTTKILCQRLEHPEVPTDTALVEVPESERVG
jgi:hypothetical protein